ncbi:MAG TPA: hypothetical protein PKI71_03120, partial [Candidatus Rifleibacterium sp.]|nr:hypothetical protein [Candidatus Rifleibacterium sp.]
MKKLSRLKGFTVGISLVLISQGAPCIEADNIQSAYDAMQQKLTEYRDAVCIQTDLNAVTLKRDAYFKAKQAYEKLRQAGNQGVDNVKQAASQIRQAAAPATSSDKPDTQTLTTAAGIDRAVQKAVSGAKVSEKDLDISFKETNDNSLELQ